MNDSLREGRTHTLELNVKSVHVCLIDVLETLPVTKSASGWRSILDGSQHLS